MVKEGNVKVWDSDASKSGVFKADSIKSFCGTRAFMVPEYMQVALGLQYSHTVAWWALGIMIYEIWLVSNLSTPTTVILFFSQLSMTKSHIGNGSPRRPCP